jgi:hypothetical protein
MDSDLNVIYRDSCIVMLSLNCLTLVFITYFMVNFIRLRPTRFTLFLVSLITFSILIGAVEYVLIILATTEGTPP